MKKRIVTLNLVIILIGTCIAGLMTIRLSTNIYKNELEKGVIRTAIMISDNLMEMNEKEEQIDYDYYANYYAALLENMHLDIKEESQIRVTFIRDSGRVLGESETDFSEMENHSDRPEILLAAKNGYGKNIRKSATLNINFMYMALYNKNLNMFIRIAVPLTYIQEITSTIVIYTLLGAVSGVLLLSIVTLRFSSYVTRPVSEVIHAAREIADGNYSKRIQIQHKYELGELVQAFNKMTGELEYTINDLKDKNAKVDTIINSMTNGIVAIDREQRIIMVNAVIYNLFGVAAADDAVGKDFIEVIRNMQMEDIMDATIVNNETIIKEITIFDKTKKILRIYSCPIHPILSGAKNSGAIAYVHDITEYRKLEEMRSEFVSNVTHELKTPLTSIRGFVETLRGGALRDEAVAEKFLEIIDIEAERLYILINDILQLSEIESMKQELTTSVFSIRELIEEVVSILVGTAVKKNVEIIWDYPKGVQMSANRNRIKQLLINLIDNAVKYNNPGGKVFVNGMAQNGKIELRIKDTGIGISEEHQQRIFERFYRVDKGRSRSMGGTGLGLSIVKHIVNLYGGNITLNSRKNKGTEFVIEMPVKGLQES